VIKRLTKGRLLFLLLIALVANASADLPTRLSPLMDAPELQLLDMGGQTVSLSELSGKVVLINFWATWCPPCLKELPSMQRLWESFEGQPFRLLAVNVGEGHDDIFAFTGTFETELTFQFLLDESMAVTRRWPITALPTTFIVNKQGQIVSKVLGEKDWGNKDVAQQIRDLIDQ
jgi:thiol-disulfide isomerase/thioredoxin